MKGKKEERSIPSARSGRGVKGGREEAEERPWEEFSQVREDDQRWKREDGLSLSGGRTHTHTHTLTDTRTLAGGSSHHRKLPLSLFGEVSASSGRVAIGRLLADLGGGPCVSRNAAWL